MTTPRHRLTALAGVALVTVVAAGCTQPAADPGPTATNVKPTASTTSSTSTTPGSNTSAPTATPMTAEEQAYAKARKAYDAYTASFASAAAAYDPTKLDRAVATDALVKATGAELQRLSPGKSKGKAKSYSMKWSQSIKDVLPTRYIEGKQVQLQICAVLDTRFFQDGTDVTTDRNGKPAPLNKDAKSNQVQFVSTDGGKTWKMNSFVYASNIGASC